MKNNHLYFKGKRIFPMIISTSFLFFFPLFAHGIDIPAISPQVQIVGGTGNSAFLWDNNTGMELIGTLHGHEYSGASGINDIGQVIGLSAVSENCANYQIVS